MDAATKERATVEIRGRVARSLGAVRHEGKRRFITLCIDVGDVEFGVHAEDELAEMCAMLRKGERVVVTGQLRMHRWKVAGTHRERITIAATGVSRAG